MMLPRPNLDSTVFEEVHQLVRVLHGQVKYTMYPFGRGVDVPLILALLRVQIN